jgi:metal-dependent HD superfamily phosphatase/phosphodiesterase
VAGNSHCRINHERGSLVLALRSLGEAVVEIFKNGWNLLSEEIFRIYDFVNKEKAALTLELQVRAVSSN